MSAKSIFQFGIIFVVAIVIGMSGGAVCAADISDIKIGAAVPLTGRMASGGKDVRAGYEIAVKHINLSGGIFIREYNKKIPIKLELLDDESDPVKSASRLEKLYSVDKVVAYLGSFSSLLNVAGMSIAEKNKVPWVGICVAVEAPIKRGFKYTFVPFAMSTMQTKTLFDLMDSIPKDQRPRKIANFELQTDWGKECGSHIEKLVKDSGYEVIVEKYAPVTKDFSSMILAAKSAGADALFSVPTPPQSIGIVKQMKELDYAPKVSFFPRGPDLTTYWQALGKDASYIMSSGDWDEKMPYAGNKKLKEDYTAMYSISGEGIGSPVGAGYSAVQVLANGIERAGTLDRNKIRDALAVTDMMTVKGPVKLHDNELPFVVYSIRQWQNGRQEIVWPRDFATAPVQLALPWNKR